MSLTSPGNRRSENTSCTRRIDGRRWAKRRANVDLPAAILPQKKTNVVWSDINCGPDGEVEGPPRSPQQAPRAHTVFLRPRRVPTRRSQTPPTIVRRRHHSLKEVMPVGTVELTTEHAAVLEICGLTGTGMGRCGRASH